MKHLRMLGLLAATAAAIMAFAASASATTVTSGGNATPTIHAVNENGHVKLHNATSVIECPSTVEVHITSHGPGVPASGPITSLIFGTAATTGCTNGDVVHVTSAGTLSVHDKGKNIGELTSNGVTVVVTEGSTGVECRYKTENTKIGTVTGGNPATLHIEASIPRHGGSIFCGSGAAEWTGDYVTTSDLTIEP